MILMLLKGMDAAKCAIRLYNGGMFFFGYPPHDLSVVEPNVIFVMSQLWTGLDHGNGLPQGPPVSGVAFARVIEATAKTYADVLVRPANQKYYNQGTRIGTEIPFQRQGPGIEKYIWGGKAGVCAATLFDSGLISKKEDNNNYLKITSRPQLLRGDPDQSRDFNLVLTAAVADFGGVKVSDAPPP